MYFLIYTSSATRLLSDEELREIHHDAMAGNARRGITGFLLYRDGNFMQLLEGDQGVVRALYATICGDSRHKDIYLIHEGERPERLFSTFAMGFANMDHLPGSQTYREFLEESANSLRFRRDGRLALRLLESFGDRVV